MCAQSRFLFMVAGSGYGNLDGWQSCGSKVGLHTNTKYALI